MTRSTAYANVRFAVASLASLALLSLFTGCRPESSRSQGSTNVQRVPAPANGEVDLSADYGQWVRPAKDFASTRFSGLTGFRSPR